MIEKLKKYTFYAIKLMVSIVISGALTAVLTWLIVHILSSLYISYSGVSSPAELSEDYGFGMLIFFVSGASAIVGFSLFLPFSWNVVSSCWIYFRKNEKGV
ncbi:MAG: hypothetical protein JNL84_06925 [Candidatus Accumulibacter sp.]|nr:hypothetical protein [Accumulibacter sp.]